jgi:hypothetical protein
MMNNHFGVLASASWIPGFAWAAWAVLAAVAAVFGCSLVSTKY